MASELTASASIKYDMPGTQVSGSTVRRMKRLYVEGYAGANSDYFLLTDFLTSDEIANIVGFYGVKKASDNTMSAGTLTYDDDDYKLDYTTGGPGDVYCWIDYYTE